jgi:LuxR family quorum-sensing system transcriptional regulator ExpR
MNLVFNIFDLPDNVCKQINSDIESMLKPFPGVIYAYAIMDKKNPTKMVIFNNYPAWFNVYLNKNFQMIDPVIIKALKSVEDFSWNNKVKMPGTFSGGSVFNDCAMYNIGSGRTFVIHDYLNNLAILSLITQPSDNVNILSHRGQIQSDFNSLHQKILCDYVGEAASAMPLLSLREMEVLSWVSTGKTYSEIASILNIAQRTVKFHISNAMKKLGVHNTRHAIRLCLEFDLLLSLE